jgi:hypothetical protein
MTEDEAKTKWCPQARDSETAGNRSAALPSDIRFPCIGSACMAWRWKFVAFYDEAGTEPRSADNKCGRIGFCGLAGAPQ